MKRKTVKAPLPKVVKTTKGGIAAPKVIGKTTVPSSLGIKAPMAAKMVTPGLTQTPPMKVTVPTGKGSYMKKTTKKKMTQAQDDAYDAKHGIKEGSKRDMRQDAKNGIKDKKSGIKMTGSYKGKSNKLGQGGRAAQLEAKGVPGGVIGNLARAAHAAPGQANYHKKKAVSGIKGTTSKAKAYLKRVGGF